MGTQLATLKLNYFKHTKYTWLATLELNYFKHTKCTELATLMLNYFKHTKWGFSCLFMKEAKLHGETGTRTLKPIHGRHTPAFFCHACLWKRQDPWRNGHSQTHNTSFFSFFSICIYERGKTHGEISIFLTLTQTHNTSSLISCLFMKEANPMELWLSSPPQSHTSVFSTPVYEISKTHGEMGPRDSLSHTHPRHTKPA